MSLRDETATTALQVQPHSTPPTPTGARVCIVSLEVNGPTRNGGIGTAYTTLACNLAATGHDVTLLYALGHHCEQGRIAAWVDHFRHLGVRLVPLEPTNIPLAGSRSLHLSYLVCQWLMREDRAGGSFDTIHFHEWLGVGYYSLLARHQGLAFERTHFCVGLHSPTRWIHEANQGLFDDLDALECDDLEQSCVALADTVWSPSRYLLGWAAERGWNVAGRGFVHPYPLPVAVRPAASEALPVRELVFFGRLEVRKGLYLFCDALDLLAPADVPVGFTVTFLGKPTSLQGIDAVAFLKERASKWFFPVRLRTDCDHPTALRLLHRQGSLAVMPSLIENSPLTVIECLALGIPFLASAVGGIPELVAQECHGSHLFAPSAEVLGARLRLALREGLMPARPVEDATAIERGWDQWHRQQPARAERPLDGRRLPLVSICFVEEAQAGESCQLYSPFEIIVASRGSDTLEAAFNRAARQSHGEFLVFIGPGETALPQALSRLVQTARQTGADAVTGLLDVCADGPDRRPRHRWLFSGIDSLSGIVRNGVGGRLALIRREAFERLDGFQAEDGPGGARLLARASRCGLQVEVIPEVLWTSAEDPAPTGERRAPRVNELADLVSLVNGQASRIHRLEEQLRAHGGGEGKFLRYRLADAISAGLGKVPLLRPLLRRLVGSVWRSGRHSCESGAVQAGSGCYREKRKHREERA